MSSITRRILDVCTTWEASIAESPDDMLELLVEEGVGRLLFAPTAQACAYISGVMRGAAGRRAGRELADFLMDYPNEAADLAKRLAVAAVCELAVDPTLAKTPERWLQQAAARAQLTTYEVPERLRFPKL